MIALLVVSFLNVSMMRQFPTVSIRYNDPISGQAAYQLRRFSVEQGGEDTFWPTFWHEKEAEIESELRTINASCIIFSGDAALVWNTNYLSGSAPGVTDGSGCAVSLTLAYELWGGSDVVGKSVEIDGVERVVRGVFEGEQLLMLASVRDEDTSQSYTAIELSGGQSTPTRNEAESFILAAGLEKPDTILINHPAFLATTMALLPIMILFLFFIVKLVIRLRQRLLLLNAIVFSALLVFALTLPALLETLPTWIIPSRFSDFSFWGSLTRDIRADLMEYLRLTPKLRDIEYIVLFYKQIGLTFVSMIFALLICFQQDRGTGSVS
jgi:hypothetical protein